MTTVPVGSRLAPFAEVFSAALHGAPCVVQEREGESLVLPVERWGAAADDSDRALLSHCRGRTLDIGCGPGRMSAHLAALGVTVAGIDLVDDAVRRSRARGVTTWRCDVFGEVPGAGCWDTALLADGNLGIGGDPVRLLRRVGELLAPGGRVVADLAPYGQGVRTRVLALRTDTLHCRPFPWATVGADSIATVASAAGLGVPEVHEHAGRWFAVLGAS